ncbi:unnamed protein product, partial [Lampetra fluviatilis]
SPAPPPIPSPPPIHGAIGRLRRLALAFPFEALMRLALRRAHTGPGNADPSPGLTTPRVALQSLIGDCSR